MPKDFSISTAGPSPHTGKSFYGTYTDDEERERFREIEKKKKQEALTKQAQSMLAVTEKMRQQAMRAQIQQNMSSTSEGRSRLCHAAKQGRLEHHSIFLYFLFASTLPA